MVITKLKEDIFFLSMKDWDRRLFDELIPLPDGTSYNSYVIVGSEKTVIIDSANANKERDFLTKIKELSLKKIDYIVANHAEPDHSGSIPSLLQIYPDAKVVATQKCKDILTDLLLIPGDKFITISDGEQLSLGNKTLEFIHAPWVHWPETMLTYLREDKILFTCDLFGSHIATSDVYATDEARVYIAAKRYYAEIMMRYRNMIKKHLTKLKDYEISIIAPSHGPVYNRPAFIIDAYKEWIADEVKNEVVIPYVSMYGSTSKMVDYVVDKLIQNKITVKPFNITTSDIGELAMALVDAATIIVASPTVLVGPHPLIVYATYLANVLRPKARFATVIGSYSWGGKLVEHIAGMIKDLKVEIINPVVIKGKPRADHFKELDQLVENIIIKHKEIGIL